jgi:hypothetical protein
LNTEEQDSAMAPKRKKGKQHPKNSHARAARHPSDSEDDDQDSADSSTHHSFGQIPNEFRLRGPVEDWKVTRQSLKTSRTMPVITTSSKELKSNLNVGSACDPHLMNRFGLASWYVFFLHCINGFLIEIGHLKDEIEVLKKEAADSNDLISSLRASESNKHSINDIMGFKTAVVGNVIVPVSIREVLFRIGFPSQQVSLVLVFLHYCFLCR